ncbi:hypothetical protein T10_7115 [Trichinella papuae]|uniref:Uncharacterized protein n=1 Tax=Trichinella papuae TaxID=268474 RepID=A0A0V1MJE1_9BILA|nr:hypothetical protein T10_7115 [Trichinella papuae]
MKRPSLVRYRLRQNRIIDKIYKALKAKLDINIRRKVVAHIWKKHGCRKNALKWQTGTLIPSYFFTQRHMIKAIIQSTIFLNDGWDEFFPKQIYIFASFPKPVGCSLVNLTTSTNIPRSTTLVSSNIDGMQWEERLDGEEPKRPGLLFVGASNSRPPLAAATGVALFSHPAAASLKTSAAEASCQESALNNA